LYRCEHKQRKPDIKKNLFKKMNLAHLKEQHLALCTIIFKCNTTHKRMSWAGHVARMGEERGVYRVLVGKPEGKRPLGRARRR